MTKQVPQTDLEKMIAAMTEGRELVRELHTAVRDAKTTMREWRETRERVLSSDEIQQALKDLTAEELIKYHDTLAKSIDDATERVNDRFDTIMMICMGEDPQSVKEGRKTVIQLIEDFVNAKRLPIRVTDEIYLIMSQRTRDKEASHPVIRMHGGVDKLPIRIDNRIRVGMGYLVVPGIAGLPPQVVEINFETKEGLERGVKCLDAYAAERKRQVPVGFGGAGKPKKVERRD